jgi:hypothetical protein
MGKAASLPESRDGHSTQDTAISRDRTVRYEHDDVALTDDLHILSARPSRISFGITTWYFGETRVLAMRHPFVVSIAAA